jgi:ABC-2 type transport system ATP-binding protein
LQERLKVREAIDLYASFYEHPADGDELIEVLGLADKLDVQYRKLSGGQKQRLSIALALIGDPEVAVLDELTSGLDPQARRDTWDLIERVRDRGVTIVLVTHFMDEAERLCDRLALIDSGRTVAIDTPHGLIRRVDSEQRLWFLPTAEFDDGLVWRLPEVTGVSRANGEVIVTGRGNVIASVIAALAAVDVTAGNLRVEQANLEDAFVALTGQAFDAEPSRS